MLLKTVKASKYDQISVFKNVLFSKDCFVLKMLRLPSLNFKLLECDLIFNIILLCFVIHMKRIWKSVVILWHFLC